MYNILLSPYSKLFHIEWKLDQKRYDYNIVFDQQLHGKINISKLNNAIQRFVTEYIILNSHIKEIKEKLYWVENKENFGLEFFNAPLSDEKISAYICQPFDLEKGPLLRFALIKLENDQYRFIVVLHHIIIDGMSFDHFIEELSCYYNDEEYKSNISIEEQLFKMSELSQELTDYVLHHKESSKLFWKTQLTGVEPLNLSFLKTHSATDNLLNNTHKNTTLLTLPLTHVGQIRFDFDGPIVKMLEQLKFKYNITSYIYCQSVYALLLNRYTGQDKFCINYPIAIKEGADFIHGSQINVNIVPFDFSQISTVLDLIKKSQIFIKSLRTDTIDYCYLPSPDIVSVSNKSIFELPCSKTNLKDKKFSFNDIIVSKNENTEIDLSSEIFFEQQIQKDAINFRFRYKTNLINRDLAALFIENYKRLFIEILEQLVNNQDEGLLPNVRDYSMLSNLQFEEIIKNWNQTDVSYPNEQTVSELFQEQVFKTPTAIAVIRDNQFLTYEELNARSNQLAHYLKERGVGPTTRIGIAIPRSIEMIIGLLGILKAEAAYVPLDPTYPKDRIQFMIEDSSIPIILTDTETIDKLPATWTQVMCLDEEWEYIKTLPDNNLNSTTLPNNLAYIIYTSGSTGKPKGVAITHQALVSSSFARIYYYSDSILNIPIFSSISFDITTGLIFWCVLQGGSLSLPPEDIQQRPLELIKFIQENKVTHITFVPSIYTLLLQYKEFSTLTDLKLVFLGGEECPKDLVIKHIECLPNVSLYNEYGPTENTVWTTVDELYNAVGALEKENITIGKPRVNTKVYILDKYLHPTPIGVNGEIFISGLGLAQGYLNQLDLTAEKFIANPFAIKQDQKDIDLRLYRTGDVARYLLGGDIEFKSRVDEQIKIRGYRVELGEIESVIKSQGNIAQVIVLARGDASGDKKLIAYILPEETQISSFEVASSVTSSSDFTFSILSKDNISNVQEDLRQKLNIFLPDYMIPSFFVYLDKFPLNPNGKIDKNAFPDPGITVEERYISPRTELENRMSVMWRELLDLGLKKFGIRDNFFRLGGNSVLAIKLISKINEDFKSNLSVAEIFKYNTIEALVHHLEHNDKNQWDMEIPVVKKPEEQLLSYAQERLWFVEKYEEGSNAYNISMMFGLANHVNLAILERSIISIFSRHEILRTLIKEDKEGKGYQFVCDEKETPFTISKIEVNDHIQLNILLEKLVNHIFDLSSEYPIKVSLFGLPNPDKEGTEFYIGIVIHHIAFDGWSIDIFIRELLHYYDYYLKSSEGLTPSLNLPNLTIQYKDFSLWQRHYLDQERIEKQLNYWRNKLEDYQALNFLTDKIRPSQVDYKGRDISFELNEVTSNALRELAKELKVSLYSLLLGGYYLLLKVYSNQDDIIIGSPVANRHYNQVENLIGFFVNSLALRVKIDLKDSIQEFIQKIGEEVIGAQLHQDLPFEKLVEELKVPKDLSRHPIFQVMFAVQDFGGGLYNVNGEKNNTKLNNILQIYTPEKSVYNIAKFDICTLIDDSQTCLKGCVNYAISLYNEETIHQFIETYIEILNQLAGVASNELRQRETKLSHLRYVNDKQFEKLIHSYNQTDKTYPLQETVHTLFEEQAKRKPNDLALVYESTTLTYSQLNERANQLANYLKAQHDIKADSLIVLCLDRNEYMLISILAVLKSGAAYVPIDPNYPKERIEYILTDTKASIILTNVLYKQDLQSLKSRATETVNVLALDDKITEQALRTEAVTNPSTMTTSTNLAYVIYTSGTTGHPKGVMIEHQSIVNLKYALTSFYGLGENDNTENILQFSNYVFDASVEQIVLSLLNGYGLVLISSQILLEKDKFYAYLNKNKVTHINVTPTFLEQHDFNGIQSLKRVVLGGEPISKKCYQKLTSMGNCKIINAYGPTETTITSIVNNISKDSLAIGTPIFNAKCYILDADLRPVPMGATGELYIGGIGLARGYLNREQLTAEKFIPNPFQTPLEKQQNKNARLYKTGDLARWLAEGNIEYIGRNDFQVKIRGYRIELGEIENALCEHENIEQSVVVVKEYHGSEGIATGNKYLVGYYVAKTPLDEEKILEYLRMRLVDYMVPNKLIYLQELPITINGKLDRNKLPDPKFSHLEHYMAPRNDLELRISHVWAEVLGLTEDKVGIRDDFFRLGGDSIVSIQLVSRLRQRLELSVSVKDIFKYKNIENLCDNLLHTMQQSSIKTSVKNEHGILKGEFPLLPIQEWFFNSNFTVPHHWNQTFTIKTPHLDIDKLKISIEELIKYHDSFRLSYKSTPTKPIQYYDSERKAETLKLLDIKTLNLSEDSSQFETKLGEILSEWQNNFDLARGPIYKIGYLYGYSDGSARIFFALHHLIVDTVSWRLLAEDLKNIYSGKDLGAKRSSYRQWVTTIKDYANTHAHEKEYWLNILSDYINNNNNELNPLIVDENTCNAASFTLTKQRTEHLLRDSNKAYNTQINDILLTAIGYALQSITNSKINYITLEGHGREEIDSSVDISRTVGWFTTMYPVRLSLGDTLELSIRDVKETLRNIPNKGIGFGILIGYQTHILPRICFNYLGQLDTETDSHEALQNTWNISVEKNSLAVHPSNQDPNIININCVITNGCFQFRVISKFAANKTAQIMENFKLKLDEIIDHTKNQSRSYLTLSDLNSEDLI
jgi:amino acid adenylation domain-containing protein/non-ribosomal peptide synthase protein (TIGR01720 family)